MSRLYLSEEGRVIPTLGEEVTRHRWARKELDLPATASAATVWVLARAHGDSVPPLRLLANGDEVARLPADASGVYRWHAATVEAQRLRAGANTLDLWCDTGAMDAWSVALEPGQAQPRSALCDDGGHTWRRERMGYLNAVRAEYVVRVRLAEGEDPPAPPLVREDAACLRLAELRESCPRQARQPGPLMGRVRALSSWLASSWEHTSSGRAAQYAPWDPQTILAWGAARRGHAGQRPITMCVHYAVAFVGYCQALGIPARCAVTAGTPNGFDGHFVAEVWFDEYGKWIMVDPNTDAIAWRGSVPLSMTEIQQAGEGLGQLLEWGPGTAYQRTYPHIVEFLETNMKRGLCFRHRSVWYRADLLSRPELSPPGHGSTSYCETGLVWEERDREAFPMFPHFAPPRYFDAPPQR